MFILAQIFGILVIISNILAMQMKNKEKIIFMFILSNFFSAVNFVLLNSYSGAIICVFAIIQTFVNKFFENREKNIPKVLIGIYIIISILCGLLTYQAYIDILPIMCSILYTLSIIQKQEKEIRRLTLINIILWIIYDIVYKAYTASISDILMTISTLIGIYRFDYKNKKEKLNNV